MDKARIFAMSLATMGAFGLISGCEALRDFTGGGAPPPPPPPPPPPLEPDDMPVGEPLEGDDPPETRIPERLITVERNETTSEPALLDFPWPPPTPSDRVAISRGLIVEPAEEPISMLAASRRMTEALSSVGYSDHRFYSAPGQGFALITRMERIKPDGRPEAEDVRFLPPDENAPFALNRFMAQLFFAPEGYYRVIVFVVTAEAFTPAGETMTEAQAEQLLREGLTRLPSRYANIPFSDAHSVDALIYEFYKGPRDNDVAVIEPVRLSASRHLEQAELIEAFEAQRGGD